MSKLATNFLKWFSGLKPWVKYILIPYILLVVLHSFFVFSVHGPAIMPDESIYLSHARFFAGLPPFYLYQKPYTSFAYGLFMAPWFLFAHNPGLVYKLIIFFNGLYLSTAYVLLFLITRRIFNQDDKHAFIFSFLTSCLPGIFLRSSYALMENVFIPLFYLIILFSYYFFKKQNWKNSIILSLAVVLIFAVHHRALVILVLLLIYNIYIFFNTNKKRYVALSILMMLGGYLVVGWINGYLLKAIWVDPVDYLSWQRVLHLFSSWQDLRLISSAVAGQLLYLFLASFGLFGIGFKYLWNGARGGSASGFFHKDGINFVYFILILTLLMFSVSATFLIISHDYHLIRPDHFVYGRYNEVFLPLFIIPGLVALREGKRFSILKILLLCLFLFFILILGSSSYLQQYNFAAFSSVGFVPMAFVQPIRGLVLVLFFGSLLIYFILRIKKLHRMIVVIFLLFFLNILFCYFLERVPDNINSDIFEKTIVRTIKETDVRLINYDLGPFYVVEQKNAGVVPWFWHRYYYILQYYLPHIKVYPFDSYKNEKAAGEAVVAACEWQDSGYEFISGIIIDTTNPETESNCMGVFKKVAN